MIIRLFRSQYILQYVLLFLFTVIFRIDAILFPDKLITGGGFGEFPKIDQLFVSFPFVASIISIFLLYFQALLINSLAETHRFGERNQMITAAVYILMMSSTPQMVQPNVMLVVNLLLIGLLFTLLNIYGKDEPYSRVFDAGFLVGIASLIFFPSIGFLFFILISLAVFQIFKWREWIIPFIGFIACYLFLGVYFFWNDQLFKMAGYFVSLFDFQIPVFSSVADYYFIAWGFFAVLLFSGFAKMWRLLSEGTIDARKKFRVVFFMLLFAAGSVFIRYAESIWQIQIAFIPLSIIFAAYLSKLKKTFFADLILALIFMAIIIARVLNLS